MDTIKVVFFAEMLIADFDGATRTMFQLIDRITPEKFDFLFVCGTGPEQINGFKCINVPAIHIPSNKRYKVALPALSNKQIREQLDNFTPHVIHIATPSLLGHYALNYAKANHIPVISIYHTHFISYVSYYFKKLPFLIGPMQRKMASVQRKFYNTCNKVYVPSVSVTEELIAMGIEESRLHMWKRGIDTTIFTPSKRNTQYTVNLTGNDLPSVLFASRLVWEKHLDTLIDLYALMQQHSAPWNLIIAGDGEAEKACRQKMPHAIFTGTLDHQSLAVLYASCTVFVFPSVTETFGNVVLEAMASGLPCVIADGGGSKDFVIDGVNGFKCPENNAQVFFERIKLIMEDQKLQKKFSANGISLCREYDWDALACRYFDDLSQLALSTKGKMVC